jgi:CheY-like chemotaxis protein
MPPAVQMVYLTPGLLLVDDEAVLRTCLSEMLIAAGYSVRNASDGFSALGAIRDELPDLILSDLNMPGMSGFEFLSVVRRRFPSIRVIAMSSGLLGLPHGVAADAFYQKGTDPAFLLRIVEYITRSGQSLVSRRNRLQAPIWISSSGHNASGEMFVTITCPECLRAFPRTLEQSAATTLETRCAWCHIPIHCAIVHSATAA